MIDKSIADGRYSANCGALHVRKWLFVEEHIGANELGVTSESEPLRKILIGAVVYNRFAGEFVDDLSFFISHSKELGEAFGEHLSARLRGQQVQSYGKGCMIGTDGEYEQGNALLTTEFADPLRAAVGGGKAWIPSTGKTGGPGTHIDIPLAHKDALYVRSHYDTMTVSFADAPRANEVVVIFACATGPRLHARLGGIRVEDIKGEDGLC